MLLVEPKLLEGLQHHDVVRNPTIKSMTRLDDEMQSILQRDDLSMGEKVKAYEQKLQRFLIFDDKYENRPPVKVQVVRGTTAPKNDASFNTDQSIGVDQGSSTTDPIESEIMKSVPKTMRNRAELLLHKIKSKPDMKWNDRGELVYKGERIKNSNIVDLVNDVLRRRKHFEPRGWQVFSAGLRETNVPQDLIGHKERWNWIQSGKDPLQDEHDSSESDTSSSSLETLTDDKPEFKSSMAQGYESDPESMKLSLKTPKKSSMSKTSFSTPRWSPY
ncbi:hypothetical protein FSP39_006339 [Pinctada imbricata]|uniref:Uncharacterized protein n=1 Tax=Pinctada imbricata TaxID=66713 RepID=A0AA89C4N6_PINIB|nr:hypothetical protein FSP39_006339 [Pinctada imbricata]